MMRFALNSETYGPVKFQPVVPVIFKHKVLPGSTPYYADGKFGTILLQEITAGRITLLHTTCIIREDLALDFSIYQPVKHIHIALQNESAYQLKGTDPIALKPMTEGQFNMIRCDSLEGVVFMERGEYKTLSVYYPDERLKELFPFSPALEDFSKGPDPDVPMLLYKKHRWMNAVAIDAITNMLDCSFHEDVRQMYIEIKVAELMMALFCRPYSE